MEELEKIYWLVERRLAEEEYVCVQARELFNEWHVNPLHVEKPPPEPVPTKPEDNLTPEERTQLDLVSSLLNKAHKVRQTKKVKEDAPASNISTVKNDPSAATPCTSKSSPEPAKPAAKPPISKPPRPPNCDSRKQKPPKPKSSNKENLMKHPDPKERTLPSRKELMEKYSTKRRPSASSSRLVPAHAAAPFKTNPGLHEKRTLPRSRSAESRSGSRDSSAGGEKSLQKSASRESVKNSCKTSLRTARPQIKARKGSLPCPEVKNDPVQCEPEDVRTDVTESRDESGCVINSFAADESRAISPAAEISPEAKVSNATSTCRTTAGYHDNTEEAEAEESPFSLEKDGCRLKLPVAYRSAFRTSRLLRRRLDAELSDSLHRSRFSARLHQHSCGSGAHAQSSLLCRLDKMADEYERLSHVMDDLRLESVRESSSYSEKLYVYKMLEHVLEKFYNWEEDYNQILAEVEDAKSQFVKLTAEKGAIEARLTQLSSGKENEITIPWAVRPGPILYQSRASLLEYEHAVSDLASLSLKLRSLSSVLPRLEPLVEQVPGYEPDSADHVRRLLSSLLEEAPTPRGMNVPTPRALPQYGT